MIVETEGLNREALAEVQRIYTAGNGVLQAEAVTAAARDEDNPLHGYFEWDDGAAAEAYRLVQAGELIRRIKIKVSATPESQPVRVRAYVARAELSTEAGDPHSYSSMQNVWGDAGLEASLRESIKRDLLRIEHRYRNTDLVLEIARDLFGEGAAA